MNDGISKRDIVLYVLNILKLYSSPDTPVMQSAVCNYLNEVGVTCDRKTVGRNADRNTEGRLARSVRQRSRFF